MVEISEVPEKSDSRVTEAYLEPITLMMEFFAKKKNHKETPSQIFDRVLKSPLLKIAAKFRFFSGDFKGNRI